MQEAHPEGSRQIIRQLYAKELVARGLEVKENFAPMNNGTDYLTYSGAKDLNQLLMSVGIHPQGGIQA